MKMKSSTTIVLLAVMMLPVLASAGLAGGDVVRVVNGGEGSFLEVNGAPMMVYGMNWGWIPIGHNYMFNLWDQ
ncbi:MAG TPA: hypothetical protein VLA34_00970, partial [Candidatus Krumholzibacterium sp.]|nr:hypothetical protein [Candidatus Krumholzibacterium sp.]